MPTPMVGRRDLSPEQRTGVKYEVVIAEKQKLVSPSGKREKTIVFSRVSQSRLDEDTTGSTLRSAKRAVSLLHERLKKTGLPRDKIEAAMSNMYAIDQRAVKQGKLMTRNDALDAKALDTFIDKKLVKSSKVRFADETTELPQPTSSPLTMPTSIELPPLPND